jgi:putative transposase
LISSLATSPAGAKPDDPCRRHGISSATLYQGKVKYGGIEVSEERRRKVLEDENTRLKKLLAESRGLGVILS